MRATTSLNYRPALDGLRAVAIIAVLLFHLNPAWAPGGWLGVDLFFALSGYLITTLLLSERARTGSIALGRFWMARLRRLLPSLVTVLVAVLLASWALAEAGRRGAIAKDVVASLFYVVNWRFIAGDEQYFATLGMPSPVRHLWSLSIEEQFYLAFPLLLLALIGLLKKRWLVVAAILALAVGSAVLMAVLHVPNQDVSRIYYGTDTRMFELLIGSAAAIATARFGWKEFPAPRWLLEAGAWVGLAATIVAFAFMTERSSVPFYGGLAALAFLAIPMFLAATSTTPTMFAKVFAVAPVRGLGLISYALYLWHWPIIVFGKPRLVDVPEWVAALGLASLSIGLAWLTYRFIEVPIRSRKLRGLVPGRPWAGGVLRWGFAPAVIALSLITSHSPVQPASTNSADEPSVELVPPVYRPAEPTSATLVGNSIPASLIDGLPTGQLANFHLTSTTDVGCDPFAGDRLSNGKPFIQTAACLNWQEKWDSQVNNLQPDVVVFFVPQTLVGQWQVDGKIVSSGDPLHDQFVRQALDEVRRRSLAAGADAFAISTLTCHDLVSFGNDDSALTNDLESVRHLHQLTIDWAERSGAHVIDLFDALCADGYQENINGVPLYSDGLHFTERSAPIVWDWMRPQIEEIADQHRDD